MKEFRVSASSVPPTPRSEGEILTSSNLKSFTFNELRTATRNFRPDSVLGEGGFGSVFKGWIDEHTLAATKPGTGMVIAVKKLNQEGSSYYQPLSWNLRMKVALGAAKGLAFLHSGKAKVIYRDFKTSNSDVYSFGVVLLEMLTGRRAIDKNRPAGEHKLVEWAKPHLASRRKIISILDSKLGAQYSLAGAQKIAGLADRCLSMETKHRPTMDQVVAALEQLQHGKDAERRNPKTEQNSSGQRPAMPRWRSWEDVGNRKIAHPRPSASSLGA
ncbi:hypothetical protein B296_00034665 [Ensete ventricosum]|uniref:Serine-threonine/tyrosine-protein kinase catalytic domain-containing protein n=1 Tax=Ensete ventricosum TaxID=4639 RepID=A0A426YT83_ENSVE|nr:hypothetical protein B296_00034665 [Ensete ventricosum]